MGRASLRLACAGSGLTNSASPYSSHARGSTVGLRWTAASGTAVVSYGFDFRVRAYSEPQYQWAWDFRNGIIDAATNSSILMNYCRSTQSSCETQKDINDFSRQRLNGHKASAVYLTVTCALDRPSDCPPGYGSGIEVKSARFTVEDANTPRINSLPSGELVDPSAIASGAAEVRFSASDVGGGVYEAIIEVDGATVFRKTVNEAGGKCVAPFRFPAPCPDAAVVALSYDTATLPDGPHSVRVVVTDPTGANAAVYGPVELLTVNGNAPSSDRLQSISCPVTKTSPISLRAKPYKIPYGGVIAVTGRVKRTSPAGVVAISGATFGGVSLITRLDFHGRFKARIRPAASQSVHAVLLAPGASPMCSRSVPVAVKAKSTLRASTQRLRNGKALTLSGTVFGQVPASGKSLVIRVRGAGSRRWYEAGTVRTDASGRWKWRHRFTRTSHATTYIFKGNRATRARIFIRRLAARGRFA